MTWGGESPPARKERNFLENFNFFSENGSYLSSYPFDMFETRQSNRPSYCVLACRIWWSLIKTSLSYRYLSDEKPLANSSFCKAFHLAPLSQLAPLMKMSADSGRYGESTHQVSSTCDEGQASYKPFKFPTLTKEPSRFYCRTEAIYRGNRSDSRVEGLHKLLGSLSRFPKKGGQHFFFNILYLRTHWA